MAIPVLKLNLAPPPTLWRRQHALLGWLTLGLGVLALGLTGTLTWSAYHKASQMGAGASQLSRQAQESRARQGAILAQLRSINVQKELPRWKLAERILGERSSPWSRLTAELERSLVQDVRIRALQRSRGSDQQVLVKLKGEARTREAEAAFVAAIQKNAFFAQLILERESERQGGGVDFEYTLPLVSEPPPYVPLPKFGPARAQSPAKAAPAAPVKAAAVPPKAAPSAPSPAPVAVAPSPRPSIATPPSSEPTIPNTRPLHRMLRPTGDSPSEPRRDGESDRPIREMKR